ncbi:MAG: hypothetical protein ACLR23_07105 [Clostridia bacterium]
MSAFLSIHIRKIAMGVPAGDEAKGSRRAEEVGNGSRLKKGGVQKRGERSQELQRARRG